MIALSAVGEQVHGVRTHDNANASMNERRDPNVSRYFAPDETFQRRVGGLYARVQLSKVACRRRLMTCDPLLKAWWPRCEGAVT